MSAPTKSTKPTRGRQPRSPQRPSPGPSHAELTSQLRELRLPMFREHFEPLADRAIAKPLSHTAYLAELTELECQARRESRTARLMQQSRLPSSKSWDNFQ